MSDDEEKRPSPHLHVVKDEAPRPSSPKISPEQAKAMFMASPHLEWTTWARSMNFKTTSRSYDDFPAWQKEKRDILAREQAESISEALFSHRGRWHADVLKTLREYPEAPDAMLGILKKRINDIIGRINEDAKDISTGGKGGRFDSVKTSELVSLSVGLKTVTEAKHKSLMIDAWSVKGAEAFTDPAQFEAPKLEDQQWKVQLIGGRELDDKGMQQLMKSFYDVPGGAVENTESEGLETT